MFDEYLTIVTDIIFTAMVIVSALILYIAFVAADWALFLAGAMVLVVSVLHLTRVIKL
jgi:hypothetical protein